jgi:sugar phosphate isomerase/epimerase
MKLSCSSPMVPGETLTEKATALREWGYDAISVFWPLEQWNEAVHEELTGLEARTGVTPCEFALMDRVYGHLMDPDAANRAACRAMYRAAAEVCAEIGMVTELEFQYGPQDPMPLFDPYQKLTPAQLSDFVAMYRELAEPMTGSAALLLLEPLNRYESRYLNSVADCLDALAAVDRPRTGLLFDFFHVAIEEADIAHAIRLAGDRIKHVHLADNNRMLPGHGNIDWHGCIAALKAVGYDGYLNLECSTGGDPAATLPATAEFLRKLTG